MRSRYQPRLASGEVSKKLCPMLSSTGVASQIRTVLSVLPEASWWPVRAEGQAEKDVVEVAAQV